MDFAHPPLENVGITGRFREVEGKDNSFGAGNAFAFTFGWERALL